MRCPAFALVFLLTVFAVDAEPEASAEPPAVAMTTQVAKAIIEKTNQFRAEHDLPALVKNGELCKAATKFAKFMARTGKYGHHADGKSPAKRAEAAGYEYCVIRENIAYRTNTGEVTADSLTEVFTQGWIDSPPHRENMLGKYITETGVAIASADETTYYAVVAFGRPKSATIKLSIANESEETQTLVIEANDDNDEVELPRRTTVSITRCFPTTLSLKGRDDQVKMEASAELVITGEAIQQKSEPRDD